jgi:hypothetical protein
VKAAAKLFDSAATIVNIHTGRQDAAAHIEFYGRELLPHVKTAAAAGWITFKRFAGTANCL